MSQGTPHFEIINKFQKRDYSYKEIISKQILEEICLKITGKSDFTVNFNDSEKTYNIGRLAKLEFDNQVFYISFSEIEVESRNSFFQSFPSALNKFLKENNQKKRIYFYFLDIDKSKYNIETDYFIFMYRLMKTVGTIFLNENNYLNSSIYSFICPEDIISKRDLLRQKNSGNNSTYITKNDSNIVQVIGKTYGTNKYETTLMCIALSKIINTKLEVYQVSEQDLKFLPKSSLESFKILKNIDVYETNRTLEKSKSLQDPNYRSILYIYNLLNKFGNKKCSLCECEIYEIVQGAHIFAVSDIKKSANLTEDEKFEQAIDGENGLWLCQNHHKLFDSNILLISESGNIKYKININEENKKYINTITTTNKIPSNFISRKFKDYLKKRNKLLDESLYIDINI